MENQNREALIAIQTLTGTIDPLVRAEAKEEVKVVVKKIIEFIEKLK
jgi:hypothetical protein